MNCFVDSIQFGAPMNRKILFISGIFLLVGIMGCGDGPDDIIDHTWEVSYTVTNNSTIPIMVETTGQFSVKEEIPAGETTEVIAYSGFLAPPPDAANDFWCLSIYRASDHALVHQLSPVSNDQWVRLTPKDFVAEFALSLSDEQLNPVTDPCPRLTGEILDAETNLPVSGATIGLNIGDGSGQFPGGNDGMFEFWLPRDLPDGTLFVTADGYNTAQINFPQELTEDGNGDFELILVLEAQ